MCTNIRANPHQNTDYKSSDLQLKGFVEIYLPSTKPPNDENVDYVLIKTIELVYLL